MSIPNGGHMDQVKTHGEIEGNENKLSIYLIKTLKCRIRSRTLTTNNTELSYATAKSC